MSSRQQRQALYQALPPTSTGDDSPLDLTWLADGHEVFPAPPPATTAAAARIPPSAFVSTRLPMHTLLLSLCALLAGMRMHTFADHETGFHQRDLTLKGGQPLLQGQALMPLLPELPALQLAPPVSAASSFSAAASSQATLFTQAGTLSSC
jgi:hypothetical protein